MLKDEIWEKILAAALDEFYERGYKSATMRNIAAAALIPTGLTYSYYKNKADLFDAVLRPVLYERERFAKNIEDHLFKRCVNPSTDAVFVHIITNNFVDGLMQIMYHYKGKEWAIMILRKLSKIYLSGIGL